MGFLKDGQWQQEDRLSADEEGEFKRASSRFRNWVTADGSAGPSGEGGFKAEPERYHLYVSHACPWAHRTMIMRSLKGLEKMIPGSVVNWHMGDQGWSFEEGPGVVPDPVNHARHLHEVYTASDPDFTGRVTVPVLWDRQTGRIVNNESAEIIRMFNSAFDGLGARSGDYYPPDRRERIDEINDRVYETLNNGVYKCGFAGSQRAYDAAVHPLFDTLNWLEEILSRTRYAAGDDLTEADIRLFTTLVRFDPVYHGHFKCNLFRLVDYPALWGFVRDLYQMPQIRETVHFDHIKNHYYGSHEWVNPSRIVPAGPMLDFEAPHQREHLTSEPAKMRSAS